jgi:hypothetical protein
MHNNTHTQQSDGATQELQMRSELLIGKLGMQLACEGKNFFLFFPFFFFSFFVHMHVGKKKFLVLFSGTRAQTPNTCERDNTERFCCTVCRTASHIEVSSVFYMYVLIG